MPNREDGPLYSDLCDQWLDIPDHRCTNYWRQEIKLIESVTIYGGAMGGTYRPGTWRFCNKHAQIFRRDREKNRAQSE